MLLVTKRKLGCYTATLEFSGGMPEAWGFWLFLSRRNACIGKGGMLAVTFSGLIPCCRCSETCARPTNKQIISQNKAHAGIMSRACYSRSICASDFQQADATKPLRLQGHHHSTGVVQRHAPFEAAHLLEPFIGLISQDLRLEKGRIMLTHQTRFCSSMWFMYVFCNSILIYF